MKIFELMLDNQVVGIIEALDSNTALEVAYKEYSINSRQAISLRRQHAGFGMYILIDITNGQAIARHDSHKALAALALIQFANVDTIIIRSGENRAFTVLDQPIMDKVAAGLGLEFPKGTQYPTKLKQLREALEHVEWLQLPYTTAQLEGQAYSLAPNEDRPMAFDPESSEPKILKKWAFEPQRNRKRQDASHWQAFAAGLGYGPGVVTPEALAHLEGATRPRTAPPAPGEARSAPPKPPKQPKAPKPPRERAAPSPRPKEGTSTGKVWDIADAAYKAAESVSDWKAFKASVIELATAEGINAGTVNVQFSKWRSSNGL